MPWVSHDAGGCSVRKPTATSPRLTCLDNTEFQIQVPKNPTSYPKVVGAVRIAPDLAHATWALCARSQHERIPGLRALDRNAPRSTYTSHSQGDPPQALRGQTKSKKYQYVYVHIHIYTYVFLCIYVYRLSGQPKSRQLKNTFDARDLNPKWSLFFFLSFAKLAMCHLLTISGNYIHIKAAHSGDLPPDGRPECS